MMKISRKRFIYLIIFSSLSVLGLLPLIIYSFKGVIIRILEEDLYGYKVKKKDFITFAEDSKNEHFYNFYSWRSLLLIKAHILIGNSWIKLPFYDKYKYHKAKITSHFLLSTDFFVNNMDESKQITYLNFYNPYKRPCSNPFPHLKG